MPQSNDYLQFVLDQLAGLGGVVSRRMFSGAGIYQDETFFALVFEDTLYFKVNDTNRPDYESRGMNRFQPYKDRPLLSFTYYEVPADVIDNRDQLVAWAVRSVAAAAATAAEKKVRKKRKRAGRGGGPPAKRKRAKAKPPARKPAKHTRPEGKRPVRTPAKPARVGGKQRARKSPTRKRP